MPVPSGTSSGHLDRFEACRSVEERLGACDAQLAALSGEVRSLREILSKVLTAEIEEKDEKDEKDEEEAGAVISAKRLPMLLQAPSPCAEDIAAQAALLFHALEMRNLQLRGEDGPRVAAFCRERP